MDVTAEAGAAGAQSSQAEPAEPKQGNVKKGTARFPLHTDTILTFTHGFSASSKNQCSGWFRHPLATNGPYWNIGVENVDVGQVRLWWRHKALERDAKFVAPCFPCAFSYVISKEHHGVLAKGQIPWHGNAGVHDAWTLIADNIPLVLPADKTFFVSVTLSVFNDQEIVAALDEWSVPRVPKAFSTKCESDPQGQTIGKRLWKSRKGADLIIETADGKDIQAHKCMLIENSPVFEAMFAHDTLEKTSGRLKLKDLSHNVVYEMIQFFYLDCISSQNIDVLCDLVKVADRYDVPNLKDACETRLLEKIHSLPELGFTLLSFSNVFNLKTLKKHSEIALMAFDVVENYVRCLSLAIDNSAELLWRYAAAMLYVFRRNLIEDEHWKEFEAAHPHIASALLAAYIDMDVEGSGRMCALRYRQRTHSGS